MKNNTIKIPTWFWVVSIFFMLWNIFGVLSYLGYTFISEEALQAMPKNKRDLITQYPIWTNIIFAIAVLTGFIGSIGLLLRKNGLIRCFVSHY